VPLRRSHRFSFNRLQPGSTFRLRYCLSFSVPTLLLSLLCPLLKVSGTSCIQLPHRSVLQLPSIPFISAPSADKPPHLKTSLLTIPGRLAANGLVAILPSSATPQFTLRLYDRKPIPLGVLVLFCNVCSRGPDGFSIIICQVRPLLILSRNFLWPYLIVSPFFASTPLSQIPSFIFDFFFCIVYSPFFDRSLLVAWIMDQNLLLFPSWRSFFFPG